MSGCACDPYGTDGFTCPDASGAPLCTPSIAELARRQRAADYAAQLAPRPTLTIEQELALAVAEREARDKAPAPTPELELERIEAEARLHSACGTPECCGSCPTAEVPSMDELVALGASVAWNTVAAQSPTHVPAWDDCDAKTQDRFIFAFGAGIEAVAGRVTESILGEGGE